MTPTTTTWPEWLTPEHTGMHNAIENELKAALAHCYSSADASGMDWTMEGLFSVAANNVLGVLRRAGYEPPLRIATSQMVPMPDAGYQLEDLDTDGAGTVYRYAVVCDGCTPALDDPTKPLLIESPFDELGDVVDVHEQSCVGHTVTSITRLSDPVAAPGPVS